LLTAVGLALLALLVILGGCELFTNAIEWFGRKLRLSEGVCGSVLAAVGTALPETIVPIVAILFGNAHDESRLHIGIGAILGAPFMLTTLAFLVTGLSAIIFHKAGRRGLRLQVNERIMRHDLEYFLVVYVVAIGASFIPAKLVRDLIAAALLIAYAYYVWVHFKHECPLDESCELAPLRCTPWAGTKPRLRFVVLQLAIALAAIFAGAHIFVDNLSVVAAGLGVSPLVLAIIITPIATELPEKFNSVLWVRQGKDTLALGNITGAMVFQSCIPVAVGIWFTPWELNTTAVACAAAALVSAAVVTVYLKTRKHLSPYILFCGMPLYVAWLLVAFGSHGG